MTIATFNIDWARIHTNKNHILLIETELNAREFDILIITESISLNLPAYKFVYATADLAGEQEYEGIKLFKVSKRNRW